MVLRMCYNIDIEWDGREEGGGAYGEESKFTLAEIRSNLKGYLGNRILLKANRGGREPSPGRHTGKDLPQYLCQIG